MKKLTDWNLNRTLLLLLACMLFNDRRRDHPAGSLPSRVLSLRSSAMLILLLCSLFACEVRGQKYSDLSVATTMASGDKVAFLDIDDGTTATGLVKSITLANLSLYVTPTWTNVASKPITITTAAGATLTLAANSTLATVGAYSTTLTATGATTLTLPTTGTLATLAGTETLSNKTLVAPALGAATATSINGLTITTGTGVLTIASGKTLTVSNTLTLEGTDSSTLNIGTGGTLGTAAFTAATAYEVPITFSTGLTRTTNTITVNAINLAAGGSGGVTGTLPVANGGTGRTSALARFRARGSGTMSIDGTATKIQLNTIVENTGGYFNTTDYRWGPLPAGKYLIGFNCPAGNGAWQCFIYKNGSLEARPSYEQNTGAPNGVTMVESDGDDYFEYYLAFQTGGSSDLYISDTTAIFWGQELR